MANNRGSGFSKEDAERIAKVVYEAERQPRGQVRRQQPVHHGRNIQPIRVTSTTTVSGRYPGVLLIHNVGAGTFTASTAIWIVPGDDQELDEGDYDGYACGEANGRMTFKTFSGNATYTLDVVIDACAIYANAITANISGGTWP
ncbi:MAG: hypothetical protein A3F84_27815 [Candidatus Handelsmanbacteria bacterium RIFCSPLOWO2_12_FULL_64_10]|uniref:Uncharacterized protein n=1 Tax=Handelsmanbacteria sp. (strain RIFCSPLOWO2_12_FULL_64_10) TaxID=1817868 RepID=A0A1F6C4S1_HANXR|nr:MAG: hypothetical protein A3F84_27815 [Candidatus Handelsmanbacteria bacterium RIFCSPLOWO2_12_FULL_64_10]